MKIKTYVLAIIAVLALPLLGGAGATAYMQYGPCAGPGNLCVVGDVRLFNNDVFSDWNTATGEEASIVLDGSAGALLLGVGNATAATWSLTYTSADMATLGDTDGIIWGAGVDFKLAGDGTNVDGTIANGVLTLGDGGSTNYLSISATGSMIVLGSAQQTMNDSVELRFGTAGADSEIASDGTNTTWKVTSGKLVLGTASFTTQVEGRFLIGSLVTWANDDDTPDVSASSYFASGANSDTVIDFDGSGIAAGQIIYIDSKAAITYDVTSSGLVCGDTDIITAAGDWTGWIYDGTDWNCFFFMDLDDNNNTWGAQ